MLGWLRAARRQLRDATAWARGRRELRPGTVAFAYGRSATTFLGVITAMTVLETAIVELAVPWAWLRITLAVLCIGSLPFLAGTVAAYRIRPHLLDERSLLLRHGHAWEVAVPMSVIASIGTTIGTAPRHPGPVGTVLELGVGTSDVVIGLRTPQSVDTGDPQGPVTIGVIRFSADDAAGLVRMVDQRRTQSLRR